MKSLAVLFFGMLLWTQQALAFSADVSFYSKRGERFQVVLDGRLINRGTTDRVHLHDLRPGPHLVEIRFPDRFGALVHRNKIYLESGFQTDFMLQVVGRRPRVVMNKTGQYPLVVNRPLPGRPPRPDYDDRHDDYDRDRDYDRDHDRDERDYDRRNVMQPAEVEQLMDALKKRPFDDDKMVLARQVLRESTFYAEDLKRVLMLFSFDSKKLELAKALYHNTYDKRNFYLVYDAFRFNSDRRELEDYVNAQQR